MTLSVSRTHTRAHTHTHTHRQREIFPICERLVLWWSLNNLHFIFLFLSFNKKGDHLTTLEIHFWRRRFLWLSNKYAESCHVTTTTTAIKYVCVSRKKNVSTKQEDIYRRRHRRFVVTFTNMEGTFKMLNQFLISNFSF